MSDDHLAGTEAGIGDEAVPLVRLSHWLWRPLYAKLWWGLIPLYWLAIAEPTRPALLDTFARSGYTAVTHAIFNPIVPLIVLGAGYFRNLSSDRPQTGSMVSRSVGGRLPWSAPDDFSTVSGSSINRFWRASMRGHERK